MIVSVNGEVHEGTWSNHRNETDVYSNVWVSFYQFNLNKKIYHI